MRPLAVLVVLLLAALAACAGEPPASCGALGRVEACPCPGGTMGAQECGPSGVWGACVCPGADAGVDAQGDATPPPADGPAVPETGADATEGGTDASAPQDGPREATAEDVAPDAPPDGPPVCSAPMADCDRSAANGCETNTSTDAAHCGACGRRCGGDHIAAPTCAAGACGIGACEPAFADCDRNVANGCETNIRESPGDCGGCGRRCEFAGAAASCVSGVCIRGACLAGFADCDGDPSNGCETTLGTDDNCSACTRGCPSTQRCAMRVCVPR